MKYLESYKVFERKGNYQLFHKCTDVGTLGKILKNGYIVCGGDDEEEGRDYWNVDLRKNVIANWKRDNPKFKTISATRNFDYFGLPAFELDVEKISDKYKIIPYIENLDYYLDNFIDSEKLKGSNNKNLTNLQNQLRSKSKNAGREYWKVKTQKDIFDFGIAEEIILTDKLDVSKYVKRIILEKKRGNDKIINIIKEKYPQIEVLEVDDHIGYSDIKKALKQKEKVKEPVLESNEYNFKVGDYVKARPDVDWVLELKEYIKENIGIIYKVMESVSIVKFENVPDDIEDYFDNKNSMKFSNWRLKLSTPKEIEKQKLKNNAHKYNV